MEHSGRLTCQQTGLSLVRSNGPCAYRIAVTSRGPLHVFERSVTPSGWVEYNPQGDDVVVPWGENPAWSRWDTPGRTLYAAANREAAFAEVLQHHRQSIDHAHIAEMSSNFPGVEGQQYLNAVEEELEAICSMKIGCVPSSWRDARLIYSLKLPGNGWWVDVEHPDTLAVLNDAVKLRLAQVGISQPIDRGLVLGGARRATATIALYLRELVLFDGSLPLGVQWESKLGYGTNWAVWLRKVDDGVAEDASGDGVVCLDSGNEFRQDDPELLRVAKHFNVRIF
ncbi:conserved hypothetical protein [Cellulomonas flavigena DSM 20109]|uniref:Uncharacterized protein n=2 Tax=Cellulomonas flavigena TaxID=1711 RepID=D5UG08_CELFN|nr:conserved hypothetical protein [Cellulomonas flavigena DSM 20109]